MAAGKYREQIQIFTPAAKVSDGAGGTIAAGSEESITCWADIKMLAAKEDLVNGKISYRQPYKIILRSIQLADITNTKRIEWNSKKVSIVSVQQDARNIEITLLGYANN